MKLLLTMALLCGSLGATECKSAPDVCFWNEAAAQLMVVGDAQAVFSAAAREWAKAKQAEIDTPGSVSADALKKFTAMWAAWQNVLTEQRKAAKLMHDFNVVEMNQQ